MLVILRCLFLLLSIWGKNPFAFIHFWRRSSVLLSLLPAPSQLYKGAANKTADHSTVCDGDIVIHSVLLRTVGNHQVNTGTRSASEESNISLRSCWKPETLKTGGTSTSSADTVIRNISITSLTGAHFFFYGWMTCRWRIISRCFVSCIRWAFIDISIMNMQ